MTTTTITTVDRRVADAELYVRTRFFPPLPHQYGSYAVEAVDACNAGDFEQEILLDPELPLHPRGATFDESGSVSATAEQLVDALRLWHMVEPEADEIELAEHTCAEHAVECQGDIAPNGVFEIWDECGLCGAQSNHRHDSVL